MDPESQKVKNEQSQENFTKPSGLYRENDVSSPVVNNPNPNLTGNPYTSPEGTNQTTSVYPEDQYGSKARHSITGPNDDGAKKDKIIYAICLIFFVVSIFYLAIYLILKVI